MRSNVSQYEEVSAKILETNETLKVMIVASVLLSSHISVADDYDIDNVGTLASSWIYLNPLDSFQFFITINDTSCYMDCIC